MDYDNPRLKDYNILNNSHLSKLLIPPNAQSNDTQTLLRFVLSKVHILKVGNLSGFFFKIIEKRR